MRRALTGLLVTSVASAGLVTANPATAAPAHDSDRGAKSVRVVLAPKIVKKFRKANIDVGTLKPAKATKFKGHPAARFPIAKKTKNSVKLRGGLGFAKKKKTATVERLHGNYKTGRITGLVNDSKRKAVFNARTSSRPNLGNIRLVLTRYAAGSMNATFDTSRFERGDTFGYAKLRR